MNTLVMGRGANSLAVLLAWILLVAAGFLCWVGFRMAAPAAYAGPACSPLSAAGAALPHHCQPVGTNDRAPAGPAAGNPRAGSVFHRPVRRQRGDVHDQRIQTATFNAERTLTRDTVPVNVDEIIFWQVHDTNGQPWKSPIIARRSGRSPTSLREMIGATELSGLSERRKADELLRAEIGAKTVDWGVSVISVEIRDVAIPPGLQDAMSRRAQAEREKEARIILGSSEQQIAQTSVDAADIYAKSPGAMQLRAMNLVYESTKERGMTIVIPSVMADSMNPSGLGGLLAAAGGIPLMEFIEDMARPPGLEPGTHSLEGCCSIHLS